MTDTSPLVLVDGSSYLYRAFHAMSQADLRNSSGQPTGAVRGVISMLRRLQKDYPDSPIAVVFDAKGKTFRDEMFAEYKAQRPPMPDDLRSQIQPIHDIIDAMGLPRLVVDGVEADDVIGTLAAQAGAERPVVVSTGDKDMAQLVNDHVTLVNTMTDTRMDVAGVKEKFGIPPELIIDYLALMGDKVDNIPGVAGVGEKTALALLQALGGLKDIYQRLDEVPSLSIRGAKSLAKKLEDSRDAAMLSYELATIKCDVELEVSIAELIPKAPDNDALLALFSEMEFRSWVEELQGSEAATDVESSKPATATRYEVVTDAEVFHKWVERLAAAELFAFDTETTSLNYMQARVVGV
ncbi:MAG: 5'-3' exonuclease H3TH domain-containing protein, partial [Spongiibacter sp.]|nr:5'-3' exonuclease H3TH domain-containing protein [Spongiibacter sp.]